MDTPGLEHLRQHDTTSLVDGAPIPGMVRSPDPLATSPSAQASPSVAGLALGFATRSITFDTKHILSRNWVSQDAVTLAGAALPGLKSIAGVVSELGAGPGKAAPFSLGLWGWHLANTWSGHIERSEIIFGPMAAWHWLNHWKIALDKENKIRPFKLVVPGLMTGPWLLCCAWAAPQVEIVAWCSFLAWLMLCFQRSGWVSGPRRSGRTAVGLHRGPSAELARLPGRGGTCGVV